MKKKIFGGISALAIAAVAVWNVNLSSNEKPLSLMALANVEALAEVEEGGVTCSKSGGVCWKKGYELKMCKEYNYFECVFDGGMSNSCYNPC